MSIFGSIEPANAQDTQFPLQISSNGRFLEDQAGKPFLINGDSAWDLVVRPTKAEAQLYLDDRKARGFNAILFELIEHAFGGPANADGELPFLVPGDFTQPNEAYFQHVDWLLTQASQRNLLVVTTPAFVGYNCGSEGWCQEMLASSLADLRSYGQFLGNRYKDFDNLIWMHGGDADASLHGVQDHVNAVAEGIRDVDPDPLATAHCYRQKSAIECYGENWLTLNNTYSECNSSALRTRNDYQRSPVIPFFYLEGRYEGESNWSPRCIRSQAYWSVLGGSTGQFFGNNPIWPFDPGWQQALNSVGSQSMTHFGNLFASRPWHLLQPDYSESVVSGNRGNISGPGYVMAASATDGSVVMVYFPNGRTVTVDMSVIGGSAADAWWFDPATGDATYIGEFPNSGSRNYSTPTSNGWVLVIDNADAGFTTPGQDSGGPPPNNNQPIANAGGPYSGEAGITLVQFDGSASSDPDGDVLTFAWNFGDGSSATGMMPTRTYATSGNFQVSLVVNDGQIDSNPDVTSAAISAPPMNAPPVADPGGPYNGEPGQAVTFDGSGSSDPNGDPLTYAWDFGDSSFGSGIAPTHAYAVAGTYNVILTVNDGQVDSPAVSTTANIVDPPPPNNNPPSADAGGPYTGEAGTTSVQFDGSASSDPDGDPLTFAWDFGDGSSATGMMPTHTYATSGNFQVSLVVNDGQIDSNPDVTSAAISAPPMNAPPVADPGGPYNGEPGQAVTFDGSGSSDPNGDPLTYAWEFGDGSIGNGIAPTHAYTVAGTYNVMLTVNDGQLDSNAVATTANIVDPPPNNNSPSANAGGPYAGEAGATLVQFDGSASSDPDGDTLSYAWDFGDGSTGNGMMPTHLYATPGNFQVSLVVNDGNVDSNPDVTTASISAPPMNASPNADPGGPYNGEPERAVIFDGSGSSDANGDTLTYAWDFGDGSFGSGVAPTHTYLVAGTYNVMLTVNDGQVDSTAGSTTARIVDPAPSDPNDDKKSNKSSGGAIGLGEILLFGFMALMMQRSRSRRQASSA